MSKQYTLLLVEDQEILRIGLRTTLIESESCIIAGEADDGLSAVREALRLRPDIILMDIGLPGLDGIEATWKIKNELPRTRVIIFTSSSESDDISAAFGAGADGYCVKDAPTEKILCAIRTVSRGDTYIDPQIADRVLRNHQASVGSAIELAESEKELLALIRDEIKNEQIATELNVDVEQVARMLNNIINKFVTKKLVEEHDDQNEKKHLNRWLTAFNEELDKDSLFAEKYIIESMIGSGGIGAVFKARHLFIDKIVAIKMLHSDLVEDRVLMRGFQREGTAIANINHENIINIYDFGVSCENQPYLVMEFIEGENLSDVISREGRLAITRVLNIAAQICNGLHAAHSRGIIHCDLKPSNILIAHARDSEVVKLVDFGLVQTLPRNTLSQLQSTEKYMISGTPTYMSPEQCLGKPLDERSDIYSLGCVIFEAITGQPVFEANTALEIFAHHLQSEPPSLNSKCLANCSPVLENLVRSMLEKNPKDRPQTTQEVLLDIERCLELPIIELPLNKENSAAQKARIL